METVRSLAYIFMLLGVIVFVCMTMQSALIETAAGHMTRNMQTAWFKALLRQDMAYFDQNDVSGQAIMLSINGAKFKSEYCCRMRCSAAEAAQLSAFFSICMTLTYHFLSSLTQQRALVASWLNRFSSW